MVSAMRSEFRALAEERGFDPRVAEAMVDESVAVEGISEAGQLLTLTTAEAVDLGVADAEAEAWSALLSAVGLAWMMVEAWRGARATPAAAEGEPAGALPRRGSA